MFAFLTAGENLPFTVALTVMLGIALLEGITALFGFALSGAIDSLLPDGIFEADVATPDLDSPTALSRVLVWLRIGEVPLLMLLVVFLTAFGLIGLGIQSLLYKTTSTFLPAILTSLPAVLMAFPITRIFGGVLGRVMPKDETDAISEDSLVGRIAIVTLGTAQSGMPAEAKVRDEHGTTHYVMVEPDLEGQVFQAGSEVLLVRKLGAVFRGIANPNPVLVGES